MPLNETKKKHMGFWYKSPFGLMKGELDNTCLVDLYFETQERSDLSFSSPTFIKRQLDSYFAGKSKKFDVPIKLKGTEFQIKVWEVLMSIPFGETRSYTDVAKIIKKPRAVRAVASAIAKNKIAIIVPCHRVIRSDGTVGDYAWGTETKQRLLNLEKRMCI